MAGLTAESVAQSLFLSACENDTEDEVLVEIALDEELYLVKSVRESGRTTYGWYTV